MALGLYTLILTYAMTNGYSRAFVFEQYEDYAGVLFRGWLMTIFISVMAIILALIIGLVLYLMEEAAFPGAVIFHHIAGIHKNIIFGTPLLVIIIVSFYYIANSAGITNKTLVGILTLGLYIGAYISDIYKGAVEGIHNNQWQTAKMFGFTKYQTYRYVVFPQVIVSILPALAGQLALTIKGSALLSLMGTGEFYKSVNNIMAVTYRYPEGFLIMSGGYLLITIPLVRLVRHLEKKANYKKDGMAI